MQNLSLRNLVQILQGELHHQKNSDAIVTGFSTDSRSLKVGEAFIALRGENFDGHNFAEAAIKQGAAYLIVEKLLPFKVPQIVVKNTLQALWDIAKFMRKQAQIPFIGITGSCGKTTTKEMVSAVASVAGEILATPFNNNNTIGVPLTIFNLKPEHKAVILELGANQLGEIKTLAEIVRPNIAVITNVGEAHLAGFGSLTQVLYEKTQLFENIAENGTLVVNMDDHNFPYWQEKYQDRYRLISFSTKNNAADIYASDIELNNEGCPDFIAHVFGESIEISLPVLGKHQVANALVAIAIGRELSLSLEQIKNAFEKLQPIEKRLVARQGQGQALIIDDSYNANPKSVRSALDLLASFKGSKYFIFADMLELGTEAEQLHAQIGSYAKSLGIDQLYALGELAKITVDSFGAGAYHFSSKEELLNNLRPKLHAGLTILVKGSKANSLWEISENLWV